MECTHDGFKCDEMRLRASNRYHFFQNVRSLSTKMADLPVAFTLLAKAQQLPSLQHP